jgi:hypothetical protein
MTYVGKGLKNAHKFLENDPPWRFCNMGELKELPDANTLNIILSLPGFLLILPL